MPLRARAGFGHFELFWILLAVILATVSIRFAGWVLGVDIGWIVCVLFGLIAPVALMMIVGVVVSARQSSLDHATGEQRSTSNGDPGAVAPFKDAPSGQAAQCVRILQDEEGKRRVRIFLRDTGTFYFQEENFRDHPLEQCWVPASGGTVGFYDSEQTALREAKASIDWLLLRF